MAGTLQVKYTHAVWMAALLLVSCPLMQGQQERAKPPIDSYRIISDFADDNERCFTCHGESKYSFTDESSELVIEKLMCSDRIILREKFYQCNHKSFSCLDCHSEAHLVFPHPPEVNTHEYNTCLDCHGNDKHYAHFRFEEIETEYLQSVHNQKDPKGFSCWKCHDPHTYHISARNSENLSATIAYDNSICLSCHSDFDRYRELTDSGSMNIIRQHDWLPNQALHFRNVRCIDCHTKINDSILIAHLIVPEKDAVRHCRECHSKNSVLLATLYKFQSVEAKHEYGFLNAVIMNHAYVTGANRNYILGTASLILFGLVFAAILVHILFRIRNRNKA